MDTRSELVRLAQAGDHAAAQSLIEQSYPVMVRLALSVLADPLEASAAAREAGMDLLENLQAYPGPAAHTAWLYRTTLDACRRRLRQESLFLRLPQALRQRLRPEGVQGRAQPANPGLPEQSWNWIRAIYALEENQRLVVILRYGHDLLPNEIAQVLNWRDGSVHSRLLAAREHLLAVRPPDSPIGLEEGPENGITHHQAEQLIVSMADFRIIDEDAVRLKRHLKTCARCAEVANRLSSFENELRSALHLRWSTAAIPVTGSSAGVFEHRRRQTGLRHGLNLVGGVFFTLLLVGLIMWAPSRMALQIVPAAPPPVPTLAATETPVPSSTPTRNRAFRPTQTASASQVPESTRVVDSRALLASIYPGRIAYIAFNELSDHLFTFEPNRVRGIQKLTGGFTENSAPAWSPDGTQIAYLAQPQGWGLNQVYVMSANGSGYRQVSRPDFPTTPDPSGDKNDVQQVRYPLYGPPHWSADGKKLVSGMWADPTHHYLALLPVGDGPAKYIPVEGLDRDMIVWSPDGSAIVYASQYGQELWLYEPDQADRKGQNPRRLYDKGNWDIIFGLAWSPDSGRIAIMGGLREQDVVQVDLRIMRKFGVEAQNVPISIGILTRTPTRNSNLSWSPDGKYLAFIPVFTNNDLVNGRIMLYRSEDRSTMPPLVQLDRDISSITWSPDGRWLAYSAGYEIWAGSLAAYEKSQDSLVRIARSAGFSLSWQSVP